MATREQIVKQAQAWLGRKESNGTHKLIIDIYNAHTPLARGYKVKYTDEWCATFVSAVSIKCEATDIIPTECSCTKMIELFKSISSWMETDSYTPKPGDIMFYDWEDTGKGECTGAPNHVGIVEEVSGGIITVIEGNKGEAVARRKIEVNGRYIRGYGIPKYTEVKEETKVKVELTVLRKGAKGAEVKTVQRLLTATGYKMQNNGKTYGVDGSYGQATVNGVKAFQKAKGLTQSGECDKKTWEALLKQS